MISTAVFAGVALALAGQAQLLADTAPWRAAGAGVCALLCLAAAFRYRIHNLWLDWQERRR